MQILIKHIYIRYQLLHIMYALSRNELRAFKAVCEGLESASDIAEALDLSAISAYRAVESLSSSKLVQARREGKRVRVSPSPHGHAKALCTYIAGSRRQIEPLIGSRLLVLLSVSSHPKTLDRVAEEVRLSRESVRRIVWQLKGSGAITQDKGVISIPESDVTLARFLQDFSKGSSASMLESMAPAGTVLWSEGLEFIFSTRTPVEADEVNETGITAMSRRGLRFMSDMWYYHYAYWRPKLRKEEIALHQMLIEPNSTRNISYALLFLMKEGHNPARLIRTGEALGARTLADQIAEVLSGEAADDLHFPSRREMAELCTQYGVS